jgi:prepilin signal peptidase PulO-like enzyme (type II secretory pathway)
MDLFLGLPAYYVPTIAFMLGVIIGSFLNVFIYRFHTGKSLAGSSHCLSCQTQLHWYELFPLLSYVGLRGRCRTCSARIPSRYFWVEFVTSLSFLLVSLTVSDIRLWPLLFFLMAVLVVVAVYDLYHFVIPNEFVWTLGVVAVFHTVYQMYVQFDLWLLGGNVLAAVVAFCFFGGLWWWSSGRWIGFGDAKLAIPLALIVGISGVFSMLVLSFWIGASLSLVFMGWQKLEQKRGQLRLRFSAHTLTIKSEVPFAPFMILGFLCVYFGGLDVLTLFNYVFFY